MAYEKTIWQSRDGTDLNRFKKDQETSSSVILHNTPSAVTRPGTKFSVANMNKIEHGIYEAHEMIAEESAVRTAELQTHNNSKSAHKDIRKIIDTLTGLPEWDSYNHIITFTAKDGSTLEINIPLENLAKDLGFDPATNEIILYKYDGTEIRISVDSLVDIYTGSLGTHIKITVDDNNRINAFLNAGSITEAELSSSLLNSIVRTSEKGARNGTATLDENGVIPNSQLTPSLRALNTWFPNYGETPANPLTTSGYIEIFVNAANGVDQNTDPEGGLSWGKAFKTIQYAITRLANRIDRGAVCRINVAPGTYTESIFIYPKMNITIISRNPSNNATITDPSQVVIQPPSNFQGNTITLNNSMLIIDGYFTIRGTDNDEPNTSSVWSLLSVTNNSFLRLGNCIVELRSRNSSIIDAGSTSFVFIWGRLTIRGSIACHLFRSFTSFIVIGTTANPSLADGIFLENSMTLYANGANTSAGSGSICRAIHGGNIVFHIDGTINGNGTVTGRKCSSHGGSSIINAQIIKNIVTAVNQFQLAGTVSGDMQPNMPHLWTSGTEYDFQDGTFGRRFTGTITAASSANHNLLLPITVGFKIIKAGGWLLIDNTQNFIMSVNGGYCSVANTGSPDYYSLISTHDNNMRIASRSAVARTNAPYDIWVIYTKA